MLQVSGINKRYGDHAVLENVSFVVNAGDRLGLVGPNGCGKTTLLRIIAGEEEPDSGSVRLRPADARFGHLGQGLACEPGDTVGAFLAVRPAELEAAEEKLAELAGLLATSGGSEQPRMAAAFDQALAEVVRLVASQTAAHDAQAVLAGLGLAGLSLDTPVPILSGGQKTRLGLARLLLDDPQILLLDEPTNHLDIEALQWLEGWLGRYRGAALIVSHDRTFLDRTVSTILELDPLTRAVTAYPGSYGDYVEAKRRERDRQWTAYKDQQGRIARTQEEIRRLSGYASSIERGTTHFHIRKIAKGIARRAVVQRRRLQRELEEERVDKPGLTWHMKLHFEDTPESGQDVIVLDDLAVGYDGVSLLAGVSQVLRAGERVALVGPNGAGKTTLLRAIAGQLQPLAGRVRLGANVRLGYYSQEQENLDPASTPFETVTGVASMSETEARSFLHYFLFAGDDVFVRVCNLSHGERARLVLARLVAEGCNCLLLDEPINHLDIPSRAGFERAMAGFEGTVLAAVHDRYFIRQFAKRVWLVREGTVTEHLDLDGLPGSDPR
jgi:ATP-binding cassette subfamily F protein 3